MYTAVLMLAMTSGPEAVDFGRRGGGCSGSYGCSGGQYYSGCCGGGGGGYRAGGYYGPGNYASGGYYAPGYYASGGNYYSNGAVMGPSIRTNQSFYFNPSDNGAMIRVLVPMPDAKVWFDGATTKQDGLDRMFHVPTLAPGTYAYTVRAKWMENGRNVEQERRVQFQPGQPVTVDFRVNQPEQVVPPKGSRDQNDQKLPNPKASPDLSK